MPNRVPEPPGPSPTPSPAPVRAMFDDNYARTEQWRTSIAGSFMEEVNGLDTVLTAQDLLDFLDGLKFLFTYQAEE